MIESVDTLWLDGALKSTKDANVHLMTHTLHYGFGAYDGIRSYRQETGGIALFRAADHMRRLRRSAETLSCEVEYDEDTLVEAARDCVRVNGLDEAYVRPLVYVGEPNIIFAHWLNEVHTAVLAFAWSGYSDRGKAEGTTATMSSYPRPRSLAGLYKAKACGHYLLSVLAYSEAKQRGFGQAIFLDEEGMVCETTGENIFAVVDDVLCTPPVSRSLLPGITRDTVISLAGDLGFEVSERDLDADDLLTASEVFTTGTASGLLPIPMIDHHPIGTGTIGSVSKALQDRYDGVVHGQVPDTRGWLTAI